MKTISSADLRDLSIYTVCKDIPRRHDGWYKLRGNTIGDNGRFLPALWINLDLRG